MEFDVKVEEKLLNADINIAECTYCGELIIFLKTTKGKWMPLDMNLEPHWGKCSGANQARKRK
jgi:hypothetical protein